MQKYQFTNDMNEISGLGGAYEECCRRMLVACLGWIDAHPEASPQFGRFGQEENTDAKELSAVAIKAAGEMGYGASGAQHGAAISHALWIRANGWEAYVKQKTHPEGQVGILLDKIARLEKDLESNQHWGERLQADNYRRGAIIAEKVLGWRKYKVSNGQQEAYAPNQEAALNDIGLGSSLYSLVDEAIKAIQLAA